MRTLKFAILGLLCRRSMTGYDIAAEFNDNAFASFWYATHGQIYPELRKLLQEELVTYDVVIHGKVMETKRYTITDKGRQEFLDWLAVDEPIPPTPKDIFRLKAYFSELTSPEAFADALTHEAEKHEEKLASLESIRGLSYTEGQPPIHTPAYGDFIVLNGAILRERSYIIWLYRCLQDFGREMPAKYKDSDILTM